MLYIYGQTGVINKNISFALSKRIKNNVLSGVDSKIIIAEYRKKI